VPIVPVHARADFDVDSSRGNEMPSPPARRRVRPSAPAIEASSADETPRPSDYVVGYGRPPVHTRFKAGQSGNPRGRPKGAKGLNTLAREILTAKVSVRTVSGETKMPRIEAVFHKAIELAIKGNPRAQSQVLRRYASAVPEPVVAESASPAEELTATDLAILEELKASLLQEMGQ
jgi:hypothetical protein